MNGCKIKFVLLHRKFFLVIYSIERFFQLFMMGREEFFLKNAGFR